MDRLVLIGNGFDLAHGLKTSYADFIDWYWDKRMYGFNTTYGYVSKDILCSFEIIRNSQVEDDTWSIIAYGNNYFNRQFGDYVGREVISAIINDKQHFKVTFSPFFERIIQSIETKGWVDIENEYYRLLTEYALSDDNGEKLKILNEQLKYLQELLLEYLAEVDKNEKECLDEIKQAIYAPIKASDISVAGRKSIVEELSRPANIMLLCFNYTKTIQLYNKKHAQSINYIHGELDTPDNIIFGYGDELDENFNNLKEHGNRESLRNVKSIRYLETPNYRNMLSFIDSGPFQVLIMGHSCGNSDRTLLNTIFEHKNCVSIKPYYYQKSDGTDNYMELVQNISRNFNDMKLMRDRVVNKTFCEPLPQSR